MAVVAMHASVFERTRSRALTGALRRASRHLPLLATLAVVIFVPTMKYYFFALLGARRLVVLVEALRRPEPNLGGRYATA